MRVHSWKRRRTHFANRMISEFVVLLRELARNQAQINDTQRRMEETLKKLVDNKISGEQNGHSTDLVLGKANSHPTRPRPSMSSFPPQTEAPPGGK